MKITIYTITECQFSKEEKEFLKSHNLPFEEKNLETNKEYLTEMLVVSNNFAGTPVTKIEKEDGSSVVMKGFTKEEFEKELGLAVESKPVAAVPAVQASADQPVTSTGNPSSTPTPLTPEPVPTPVVEPPAPPMPADLPEVPPTPPAPPVEQPPVTPPQPETSNAPLPADSAFVATPAKEAASAKVGQDQQLNSILNDLQSMVNKPSESAVTPTEPTKSVSTPPSIPNPTF